MIYYNLNYHKWVGYVIGFCDSNYENDHDIAISNTGIKRNHQNSGYIYNNIDKK